MTPLKKGSSKWKPFENDGGYVINFGGDGIFQYHPGKNKRHGGKYWKIGNGKIGLKRYSCNGSEIFD